MGSCRCNTVAHPVTEERIRLVAEMVVLGVTAMYGQVDVGELVGRVEDGESLEDVKVDGPWQPYLLAAPPQVADPCKVRRVCAQLVNTMADLYSKVDVGAAFAKIEEGEPVRGLYGPLPTISA